MLRELFGLPGLRRRGKRTEVNEDYVRVTPGPAGSGFSGEGLEAPNPLSDTGGIDYSLKGPVGRIQNIKEDDTLVQGDK